jgi:hypothetical protein
MGVIGKPLERFRNREMADRRGSPEYRAPLNNYPRRAICRDEEWEPTEGTHERPVGRESSSSKAFASSRSAVSKPSVNQP